MAEKKIIIFGNGGFAREVQWLAETVGRSVAAFVDRDDSPELGKTIHDIPVVTAEEARWSFPDAQFVVGVGDPKLRGKIAMAASGLGFVPASLIHPNVAMSKYVNIGEGTLICAGSILTCDIKIGKQVHINLDCTIGHDVVIGDYVTLSPGVHVSGNVTIGDFTTIGTGAAIINGAQDHPLLVGDDVVIGSQACVTREVATGQTVVGVPARPAMGGRVPPKS